MREKGTLYLMASLAPKLETPNPLRAATPKTTPLTRVAMGAQ